MRILADFMIPPSIKFWKLKNKTSSDAGVNDNRIVWDAIKAVGNQISKEQMQSLDPSGSWETAHSSVRIQNLVTCSLTQKLEKHKGRSQQNPFISALYMTLTL